MYEFLISAIPSTVLSLQPNTNRVQGKFIPYVLSRAIPGALTMAIGILSLRFLQTSSLTFKDRPVSLLLGLTDANGAITDEYQALLMITLTYCGLVMLYRVCQPFNMLRAILFISSAALCSVVLAVPALGNFVFDNWTAVQFTLPQMLIVIILVQASFPISGFLIKAFDMMNPAEE